MEERMELVQAKNRSLFLDPLTDEEVRSIRIIEEYIVSVKIGH